MLHASFHKLHTKSILVGAVCDPVTQDFTYGGAKHIGGRLRPFLCEHVKPNGTLQPIDVMNGNVVLIPGEIALSLGNLNPIFEHAMGDTEYAMRARKVGIGIFLTDKYVGECSLNNKSGTHEDTMMSLSARYKWLFSRKGLPLRSWYTLCSQYGGLVWPIQFFWGYLRLLFVRRHSI
jgi:GT2 family glycosyltransferase